MAHVSQHCLICGKPQPTKGLCDECAKPINPTPSGTDDADAAAAGAGDGPHDSLIADLANEATAMVHRAHKEWAGLIDRAIGRIESQAARIRELEAERQWRPIETAPKDGTRILLRYARDFVKIGKWDAAHGYWEAGQWFHERAPTHWMGLPLVKLAQRAAAEGGVAPDPVTES